MTRPRLLLTPMFTELVWGVKPQLEEWADVVSYDPPGVGAEPLPEGLELDPSDGSALYRWHEATARRGLAEVDRLGWDRFVVVADSYGIRPGVLAAKLGRDAVQGLVLGHASLSRARTGKRAPLNAGVYEAMGQLLAQDHRAFIVHGVVQLTHGSMDEELAERVVERLSPDLTRALWTMFESDPAPIGEELAGLDVPLLFAQHVDCLGSTQEGFDDIVAAFPQARTAGVELAPPNSPEFVEEVRKFCDEIGAGAS